MVVAELSFSWVTAPREAPLPGYACVVAKRHVEEPFHLAFVGPQVVVVARIRADERKAAGDVTDPRSEWAEGAHRGRRYFVLTKAAGLRRGCARRR